jgi:hypothetical protein
MVCHVDEVSVEREKLGVLINCHCCYEAIHCRNRNPLTSAYVCYSGSLNMGLLGCKDEWKTRQGLKKPLKLGFFPYSLEELLKNDSRQGYLFIIFYQLSKNVCFTGFIRPGSAPAKGKRPNCGIDQNYRRLRSSL